MHQSVTADPILQRGTTISQSMHGSQQRPGRLQGGVCRNQNWVTEQVRPPLARRVIFNSLATGKQVSYHILTPPNYAQSASRRYPVLYWLHGSGPSTAGISQISGLYYGLMQRGKIPPMIMVFPNGLINSMWINSRNGCTPVETVVISELIPHVDSNFRTIRNRSSRIIEGHSMGGYGALRLGLKYPNLFSRVSALGPGPLQESLINGSQDYIADARVRERVFERVYGNSESYYQETSPASLARAYARVKTAKPNELRLIVGTEDDGYASTLAFHKLLQELGISHQFIPLMGVGHAPAPTLRSLQADAQIDSKWRAFYEPSNPAQQP